MPIFEKVNSYLECEFIKLIEGGDHDIVLAEIKNAKNLSDQHTLNLFSTGWNYGG